MSSKVVAFKLVDWNAERKKGALGAAKRKSKREEKIRRKIATQQAYEDGFRLLITEDHSSEIAALCLDGKNPVLRTNLVGLTEMAGLRQNGLATTLQSLRRAWPTLQQRGRFKEYFEIIGRSRAITARFGLVLADTTSESESDKVLPHAGLVLSIDHQDAVDSGEDNAGGQRAVRIMRSKNVAGLVPTEVSAFEEEDPPPKRKRLKRRK